jgi:hypothetical protein
MAFRRKSAIMSYISEDLERMAPKYFCGQISSHLYFFPFSSVTNQKGLLFHNAHLKNYILEIFLQVPTTYLLLP